MLNFPDKKYQIIYADPAWSYNDKLQHHGGSAQSHYSTMSVEDICKLPVNKIADENCYLFLWTTSPTLKDSLQVIDRWGFNYKIIVFVWSKINREMGLGNYTRTNHEFVLLGTKGKLERQSRKVKQWIKTPSTNHSQKPNEVRDKIIQLMGDLPRIELFARTKIHGWDVWGDDPNLQNKPLEVFS